MSRALVYMCLPVRRESKQTLQSFRNLQSAFYCVYMCLPVWRESKQRLISRSVGSSGSSLSTCAFPFGGNRNSLVIVSVASASSVYMCLPVWRESKQTELRCILSLTSLFRLHVPSRLEGIETYEVAIGIHLLILSTCAFPFGGNRNLKVSRTTSIDWLSSPCAFPSVEHGNPSNPPDPPTQKKVSARLVRKPLCFCLCVRRRIFWIEGGYLTLHAKICISSHLCVCNRSYMQTYCCVPPPESVRTLSS